MSKMQKAAKKAWKTRRAREAGKKAWVTIRNRYTKEEITERASKAAKKAWITRRFMKNYKSIIHR